MSFRAIGRGFQYRFIGAMARYSHIEVHFRNCKAVRPLVQCYRCRRLDLFSLDTHFPQLRREGHRETARVGRSDQLLWIGPDPAFKSGYKGILRIFQYAGFGGYKPFSGLEVT